MKSKLCMAVLVSIALSLVAACSTSDNGKDTQQPQKPPPLPVEVITVQQEAMPIWLEYTGKTEATKRIEVRARVAGRLEKVLFTEGDLVEKGQKLFEIEKAAYQAALDQAKAKLERDQASLELARADVKRYEPLVEKGLAPRATLEQYEARKNELIATIKSDEAAINNAALDLSYTDVVAPISGRISRRYAELQQLGHVIRIPPGDPDRRYMLYLHVPFCVVLCPFCSFHRVEFREDRATRYFTALQS